MNKFTGFFSNLGKYMGNLPTKIKTGVKNYFKPVDIQKDMLRYKNNKLGRYLCFIAIFCNCLAFSFIYSHISNCTFTTGMDIVYNIVMLLLTFLVAESVKVYKINASYFAVLLSAINLGHMFWYLMPLNSASGLTVGWAFGSCVILYIISVASLFIAGVSNFYRGTILQRYLKELAENDEAARLELDKRG